jgi:hypothetical protein
MRSEIKKLLVFHVRRSAKKGDHKQKNSNCNDRTQNPLSYIPTKKCVRNLRNSRNNCYTYIHIFAQQEHRTHYHTYQQKYA